MSELDDEIEKLATPLYGYQPWITPETEKYYEPNAQIRVHGSGVRIQSKNSISGSSFEIDVLSGIPKELMTWLSQVKREFCSFHSKTTYSGCYMGWGYGKSYEFGFFILINDDTPLNRTYGALFFLPADMISASEKATAKHVLPEGKVGLNTATSIPVPVKADDWVAKKAPVPVDEWFKKNTTVLTTEPMTFWNK